MNTIRVSIFYMRLPFKVDIIRDRASLVRETDDGWLENSYNIKIMNVSNQTQHFKVTVDGMHEMRVQSDEAIVTVHSGETKGVGVRVQAEPEEATKGSHKIHFIITQVEDPSLQVKEKSSFIGE